MDIHIAFSLPISFFPQKKEIIKFQEIVFKKFLF